MFSQQSSIVDSSVELPDWDLVSSLDMIDLNYVFQVLVWYGVQQSLAYCRVRSTIIMLHTLHVPDKPDRKRKVSCYD